MIVAFAGAGASVAAAIIAAAISTMASGPRARCPKEGLKAGEESIDNSFRFIYRSGLEKVSWGR